MTATGGGQTLYSQETAFDHGGEVSLQARDYAFGEHVELLLTLSSEVLSKPEVATELSLTDAAGHPIPKALVSFSVPLRFLEATDEVVVAQGVTDAAGIANVAFDIRTTGSLKVTVAFAGDARYAPSQTASQIVIGGDTQLYVQDAGVHVPALGASASRNPRPPSARFV